MSLLFSYQINEGGHYDCQRAELLTSTPGEVTVKGPIRIKWNDSNCFKYLPQSINIIQQCAWGIFFCYPPNSHFTKADNNKESETDERLNKCCYLETGISVTFLCKVKTQGEWTLGYLTGWANCLHSFHWVTQWSIVYVCGRKSDRKRKDWTDKEQDQTKKEKTQRTVKQQSYKSVESWGQRSTSY